MYKYNIDSCIITVLGVHAVELGENTHLEDDLNADSLDRVELFMELENRFNIDIPDNSQEKIKTVGDIYKYIDERMLENEKTQ